MPHLPRSLHSLAVSLHTIPNFPCHIVALPNFLLHLDMPANPHIPPIFSLSSSISALLCLMLCTSTQHSLVMFPPMLHPAHSWATLHKPLKVLFHHPCQLPGTSIVMPQHYPASIPIFHIVKSPYSPAFPYTTTSLFAPSRSRCPMHLPYSVSPPYFLPPVEFVDPLASHLSSPSSLAAPCASPHF